MKIASKDYATYQKPDRAWGLIQQQAWETLPTHDAMHPWEEADALLMGAIYARVWRRLPTASRLRYIYYLPQTEAVLRLFGSLKNYHTAITAQLAKEQYGTPEKCFTAPCAGR